MFDMVQAKTLLQSERLAAVLAQIERQGRIRVDEATTILQRHAGFTDSHMATPY